MSFICARDQFQSSTLENCILNCLSENDGLYLPSFFQSFTPYEIANFQQASYIDIAVSVLNKFCQNDLSLSELRDICTKAYSDFPNEPLKINELNRNLHLLDMSMGPTMCVKDHGANLAAQFVEYFNTKTTRTIIDISGGMSACATMSAVKKTTNLKSFILINKNALDNATSAISVAQISKNVIPMIFDGNQNFIDKLQNILIANQSFRESVNLTFIDERNLFNILAYTIFFIATSARMHNKSFCLSIPTGNMGIAVGAYFAKLIGAPIAKIILACENNHFLQNLFNNGKILREPIIEQKAKAINVSVPLNFERLLFFLYKAKQSSVNRVIQELYVNDRYDVSNGIVKDFKVNFFVNSFNEEIIINSAVNSCKNAGFLIESHTALAYCAAENFINDSLNESSLPILVCQTAGYMRDFEFVSNAVGYNVEGKKENLSFNINDANRFKPLKINADATDIGKYIISKTRKL